MKRYESQEKVARWLEEAGMPEHTTVAPLIFEFSKGNSSSELGCAHLCAVLAGYPVPLQLATAGFDQTRKSWFIRAMMEVVTDQWRGFSERELETLWKRHPVLRTSAEAAEEVWNQALGRK